MAGSTAPVSAASWQSKVDPWVLQTAVVGETEFLVYLTAQADLNAARLLTTRLEKGRYVFQELTSIAGRTQKGLLTELDRMGLEYRPYWIANMVWVRGNFADVQLLAQRYDVDHLYANPSVKLDAPEITASPRSAPQGVEWNISQVNAPLVWSLGYTGQDVVIGGQDTGYQWDHPALIKQYRGWDGENVSHDYNWHDAIHENNPGNLCGFDSPVPCDDNGHGTHTMGTMVGDDGGSNQIGMAPGARWIGCRNMEQGVGKPSTYAECYEWFVAPYPLGGDPLQGDPAKAPDVINNSWSCPPSEGCTDPNVLLTVVHNLVAAGIVTVHSAGNSGSGCSTVRDPAAIYDESFTVGATDSGDKIASFSSRGPVTEDGSNRPKPDISAPGVNIRSSFPGGTYANSSGTSMAAPHVAGAVALLISANPALRGDVDEIESTIEASALGLTTSQGCGGDSPYQTPNNVYGWGRVDALAAVMPPHLLELNKVASDPSLLPGEDITYTLSVTHTSGIGPTNNVVLFDTLPTGTSFVTATDPYTIDGDTVLWSFPSLPPMGTISVDLVVNVDFNATGMITNENYAVRSDHAAMVHGEPVSTDLWWLFFLPVTMRSP